MEDTLLAFQNVANAVESMGLGYVPLGTVNDHPLEMLKTLDLPKLTFPVLGCVGRAQIMEFGKYNISIYNRLLLNIL